MLPSLTHVDMKQARVLSVPVYFRLKFGRVIVRRL